MLRQPRPPATGEELKSECVECLGGNYFSAVKKNVVATVGFDQLRDSQLGSHHSETEPE